MTTKKLKRKPIKQLTGKDFVSTGSTLLNLACTDHPNRGFAKGHYYLIVGDTKSGKTFLSLTCLAEASINRNFKNHRFIYDNTEEGALMNLTKFFGTTMTKRLRAPRYIKGEPTYSETLEDFYYNLDDACKKEKPFIYILDSIDSVTSEPEKEKFNEKKKAFRSGKTTTGTYGDGKAKINSANLRRFIRPLKKTGSILIIINQTRASFTGYGKSRAGGQALPFYACLEIRSSVKETISKTYRDKKWPQGVLCKIRTKKNRVSGRDRIIYIPIYNSVGIDEIGSCIDYLIDMKHWKKKKASIIVPEFNFEGMRNKLIQYVSDNNLEKELQKIVAGVWREIEEAVEIVRKKRYE